MISLIYSTTNSEKESQKIAQKLVENKLVACVNIIPQISSIYRWQGNIETNAESLIIAKTTDKNIDKTIETIKSHHSYEVPDIIVLPITHGLASYIEYVQSETE